MSDDTANLLDELGLGAPAGGNAPKIPVFIRALTEDDLRQSLQKVEYGGKPAGSLIKKLRFPHHTLARLLAEGKGHPECAAITGYAIGSIVAYSKDPAFRELVSYYKTQIGVQYLDVHERLATLGTTAMEILQERLEEEPDKVTVGQLVGIVESAFDRSVAPNKSAPGFQAPAGTAGPQVINIHFGEPGAQQLPAVNTPMLIDITPEKPHGT